MVINGLAFIRIPQSFAVAKTEFTVSRNLTTDKTDDSEMTVALESSDAM